MLRLLLLSFFGGLLISSPVQAQGSAGLDGKIIVGYQGWFACPHDFSRGDGWHKGGWDHWFSDGQPDASHVSVDMLPTLAGIDTLDQCDTDLKRPDGAPIRLYSSQNPRVVSAHFSWMAQHQIDGAAVQRFVSESRDPAKLARLDHLLENVRSASEKNGRVFYVTYDISGADPKTMSDDVRRDWKHLVDDLHLTSSSAYLRDNRRPVLELWGAGFGDRPFEADQVLKLIADLKGGRVGLSPVTLIGGVPTYWRTLTVDSRSDSAWTSVYRSFDVLSPWSVGRFADDAGADAFLRRVVLPDLAETHRLGIRYMPVIFPGFSWYNLQRMNGQEKLAIHNKIPRRCGNFLWRQASNLLTAKVTMLRAAMFDEVDEGTALFPVETRADKLPVGAKMVYLNEDGCSLPSDWYLQVTGEIADFLHKGEIPPAHLDSVLRP